MRAILGALAGAVVLFVWGFVFWVQLAWTLDGLRALEPAQEEAIVATLQANIPETGVYYFPGMPTHGKDLSDEEGKRRTEEWTARHEAGPLGTIVFNAQGRSVQDPVVFIRGFLINLIATILVSIVVIMAGAGGAGFGKRWMIVLIFGLGASVTTHLVQWNWMYVPTDNVIMACIDTVVGWALAGLAIAAIIRTPKARTK
ncbi:MAG: hypothetical protein D6695_07630 [Planctomycetota bacterium]|nr:MAG: hypothetical protein D6695_07630 [Planctomycetota bacterium]